MDTIKIEKKNVLMVAHRGLSGLETENTQCAFVAAGNRSYYGIETDVHATKDGKYVISHDENLARIFGKDVFIRDLTFDEVRKVRKDENGYVPEYTVVPTLSEYLAVCKKYGKVSILELKVDFSEEQLREIVAEVEAAGMQNDIVYISFFDSVMVKMRAILPNAKLQFLTCEVSDRVIDFLVKYDLGIDCGYGALTKENVALMKSRGIEVNCWTVNDAADAEKLVSYGVDYITTNILE